MCEKLYQYMISIATSTQPQSVIDYADKRLDFSIVLENEQVIRYLNLQNILSVPMNVSLSCSSEMFHFPSFFTINPLSVFRVEITLQVIGVL